MISLLLSLTDTSLAFAANVSGILALFSTAIVVIGLVFEYIGAQSDIRTSWSPLTGGPPQYWDKERIGDLLIVAGVLGELLFGVMALIVTSTLDTNRQKEIAQLESQMF